jgi:hypothetical protein
MKNNNTDFLLILISYFSIGIILSQIYVQHQQLKVMNDSIKRLIMIELITEEQFNLLHDKVKNLEKHSRDDLTIVDNVVYWD